MPSLDLNGSTPKGYERGTHRTVAPAETLRRLRPLLKRFGITRLANVTGLDDIGIPVTIAVRPNARSLSVSQGKGTDLDAAKASALMESIEQHHAEHDRLPVRWCSHDDLTASGRVVDVDSLPRLSQPWAATSKILWTEGRELVSGETVWVPYELVHLNFTLPLPPGSGYFLGGSNGLASGNHPLEALVHGLTEVIERDALSLFYRLSAGEQRQRRIDPATVDDVVIRSLLGRYQAAGISVAIWDATSDVEVPVYLCDVVDREDNPFRRVGMARGSGCHADPIVAVGRALTEAAQSRLTRIAGTRDDLLKSHVDAHRSDAKMLLDRARIHAAPERMTAFARLSPSFATFEQEARFLVSRIGAVGAGPAITVDLSDFNLPFHVLRVLVPGLEGPSENPGYLPGRRARRCPVQGQS
jgi:YcaO-like protein with predicted kinase domain